MIYRIRSEDFKQAYGILCNRILPFPGTSMPFGATSCQVPPGGRTSPHDHFDGEVFLILKGQGQMAISESKTEPVGPGDVVFIPPHHSHILTNLSKTDPLEFVSIYWDHVSELFQSSLPEHSFIIAAPPTPNGDLHVGHLSGPYLAADIYRRFLNLHGKRPYFLCGSDDHQSYVPTKAKQLSSTSPEVVDRFAAAIQRTLGLANIKTDRFVRPMHDEDYIQYVQTFFQKLVDNGAVRYEESPILFCATCEFQVFEAHVRGKCPHCNSATNGHGCEQCGLINDAHDLLAPVCNHCGNTPEKRVAMRHRFSLESKREFLTNYHRSLKKNDRLLALSERLLNAPLADISASFKANWGIPVPGDNPDGLVIYEWLEMAAGYRYIGEKRKEESDRDPFTSDALTEIVLFFGFDNSFFYSTFIPAILHSYDEKATLPRALVTNEFYRLEGLKFSTGRNHAIWGCDLLSKVSSDLVRFHLAYDRPEDEQTNFKLAELAETASKLTQLLEGWLTDLSARLNLTDRVAPKYEATTPTERIHHSRVRQLVSEIDRYYRADNFSPRAVARRLLMIVEETRAFATKNAFHQAHNRRSFDSGIALELASLRALAFATAPLMPEWSESILGSLNAKAAWDADVSPVAQGEKIPDFPHGRFRYAN